MLFFSRTLSPAPYHGRLLHPPSPVETLSHLHVPLLGPSERVAAGWSLLDTKESSHHICCLFESVPDIPGGPHRVRVREPLWGGISMVAAVGASCWPPIGHSRSPIGQRWLARSHLGLGRFPNRALVFNGQSLARYPGAWAPLALLATKPRESGLGSGEAAEMWRGGFMRGHIPSR